MLYFFCVECRDKTLRNKRYNAYSVVATHDKCPRVDFAFARQPWAIKRTTLTALRGYNIDNCRYVHWNISAFCYLFIRMLVLIVLQNTCFNAVGVVFLIAQGCQTIVQATLG